MDFGMTLAAKRQEACPHTLRIAIRAHGVERQICESCDHVSFAFMNEQLSEVDRNQFARPVDQLATAQN